MSKEVEKLKVGGKSPAARDEAHEVLAARRGVGDMIKGSRGREGKGD